MKNIVLTALLLGIASMMSAQDINQAIMKKDIEVAEDVLSTLASQYFETDSWGQGVEGNYIEGYGLVFTIRSQEEAFILGWKSDNVRIITRNFTRKGVQVIEDDELADVQMEREDQMKSIAFAFLKNYGFLIRQLQPNEKIMLNFVDNFKEKAVINPFPEDRPAQRNSSVLTAEVAQKEIKTYRAKKLSEEEFEARILFGTEESNAELEPDLELLVSMFSRLYQDDLTETFAIRSEGRYTRIKGLGAILEFDLYGTYNENSFSIEFDDFGDCESCEKQKKAFEQEFKTKHEVFLEDFKENIIEYGRTVSSLAADERLIFKLHFDNHQFGGTDTELSITRSVIQAYDEQKLSLADAMEEIKTTTSKVEHHWR